MEVAPNYGVVVAWDEALQIAAKLTADLVPFGFDIETGYDGETREDAQLHPEENFIAGISFANDLTWGRYFPLRHDSGVNLDNYRVAELIWPLFWLTDSEGLPLGVAHGAIFELRCMARWFVQHLSDHPVYGEQVRATDGYFPVRSDTMVESYVEAKNPGHGLKFITELTFGHKMTEIMELFPDNLTKSERDSIRFSVLDQHDPKVYSYACEDSVWCLAHHRKRFPVLRAHPIYVLEMSLLTEVLCDMADTGVFYDWNLMRDASRKAHEFLPLYESEVRSSFEDLTGQPCTINFRSPPQLARLLYEDLGLPVIKRTKNKKPSTNAKEVLVNFVNDNEAVAKFVKWKGLQTLCSSYLDTYEKKFSYAPDGMTHPDFLQHGSVTGRGAHASPNYAQTSKQKYKLETRDGAKFEFQLRKAVAAPPGWYILGFDYSMMELRVIAGEAGEEGLLSAFRAGIDVHKKTAVMFTGKAWEDITKDDRQVGKTGNFSLGYGQTAGALAERLGCSQERAEELYTIYHSSYPRLNKKRMEVIAQARRDGFIITKFGRKVPLPEIFSSDRRLRDEAERTAGNAFVQGPGTGDYPKIAMVRAKRALKAAGLDKVVRLAMNIHDALEFYVRKDVKPGQVIRVLQDAVVFPVPGWPPIVADWHMGLNWADLAELEVLPDGSVRVKKEEPKPAAKEAPVAQHHSPPPVSVPVGTDGAAVRPDLVVTGPGPVAPVHVGPARTVVIETGNDMPPAAGVKSLAGLARLMTGPNTVILRTPKGDVSLPATSGITPDNEPEISIMLGGAVVRYDESSVDMAALGAGLSL